MSGNVIYFLLKIVFNTEVSLIFMFWLWFCCANTCKDTHWQVGLVVLLQTISLKHFVQKALEVLNKSRVTFSSCFPI